MVVEHSGIRGSRDVQGSRTAGTEAGARRCKELEEHVGARSAGYIVRVSGDLQSAVEAGMG
jgi:hypothetical protein